MSDAVDDATMGDDVVGTLVDDFELSSEELLSLDDSLLDSVLILSE
jgi:hypothetical protein